jgi:hypothetical protein
LQEQNGASLMKLPPPKTKQSKTKQKKENIYERRGMTLVSVFFA